MTTEAFEFVNGQAPVLRLPYCPYDATAKQEFFLLRDELEVFFGGAAGPGKSWALLMAALQHVDQSGYHALLLRPELTEFEQQGGLIEVSHDWLGGTEAHWNGTKRSWTFPSGATVKFGYLANQADLKHYKGGGVSFVGYDELTSFPDERLYLAMFRVLRQGSDKLPGVPLRMRAASNPGDVGHCVPYGDVLTPHGWRRIEEMRVGDPVYAVAPDGALTPSTVEQVHRAVADEIIEVETRNLHMAVTPEHRVAKAGGTRAERGQRFSLVPFADLPGQATVLRSAVWSAAPLEAVVAERPSGLRASRCPQPASLDPLQYARLLGWFLSEGSLVARDRALTIAQTKPASRELLRVFLEEDCGFTVSWSKGGATVYAPGWYAHLAAVAPGHCRQKRVPRALLDAPPDVLAAFLDAAMEGDGHRSGTGGQYYTTSLGLADDVSEIAVKLGYIVKVSERQRDNRVGLSYCVNLTRRASGGTEILTGQHIYEVETETERRSKITRRSGPTPVYCIGVPEHHAFVLRQRGSVWISGNSWVKNRFVDPETRERGALYIPAKMRDNPFLDVDEYLKSLAKMHPTDRQRLIDGDWDVAEEGSKFRRPNFKIIEAHEALPAVKEVRYWDLAATEPHLANTNPDYTVGLLYQVDRHGTFTIKDVVRGQWADHVVEEQVRQTATEDGRGIHVYIEQDPGSAGKALVNHYKRRVLQGFPCHAGSTRINGRNEAKEVRARPVAAAVGNELVQIIRGRNTREFLNEVCMFPNAAHDDCVDALSGAHNALTTNAPGRSKSSVPRARIPGVQGRAAIPGMR